MFAGAQKKIGHLFDGLLDIKDPFYPDCLTHDCYIITWLLNSMEETINSGLIFLMTAKEIWNILKEVYNNKKNISRIFEFYERIFILQQGEMYVHAYCSAFWGMLDELNIHRPLVIDMKTLQEYR